VSAATEGERAALFRAAPPRAVLTGLAVAVAGVLPSFLLGALALQMGAELGFGAAGLGGATTAFFVGSALGSVPLGRLADRLGGRTAMRTAALGSAACMLGVALLARSYASLLVVLVAGGMANALAQPAVNAFLAGRVALDRQGLVFGIKQSAIPVAVLLSGLALPVVALTVGWRFAYAGGAVMALGAALAVSGAARVPEVSVPPERPSAGPSVARLAPLGVAAALGAFSGTALGAFLVTSAVAADVGEGAAGVLLATGSLVSLAVRVGAGWLADRTGSEGLVPTVGLLAVGTLGFALLAVQAPWALVLGTLVAFGAGWGWPGLFNFAVVVRHPGSAAAATGITQTGVYAGAGIGPLVFGQIVEGVSLPAAWFTAAACAALAALIVARSRRLERGGGQDPSRGRTPEVPAAAGASAPG
jgi:MFS family permease